MVDQPVVICFQIFLWQDLQQPIWMGVSSPCCCDLLSDFSLTRFTTTYRVNTLISIMLWFAFRFFFDKIYNNDVDFTLNDFAVVICFQIFLWQDLQQLAIYPSYRCNSCDLLSDFSLTRFTTTFNILLMSASSLWFAFRFFFDKIYNNLIVLQTDKW